MPLPKPNKDEEKQEFLQRCMNNKTTKKEFPDNDQRIAVCEKIWDEKEVSKIQYINKSSNERLNYTLGVVYSPGEVDLQGEYTDEETLREGAWNYMKKLQNKSDVEKIALELYDSFAKLVEGEADEVRVDITDLDTSLTKNLGDMHRDVSDSHGTVVESYITPVDIELNGEKIKKGSWLMGVVWSDEMFEKILAGERTGYSMGGSGVYIETEEVS